MLWCSGDTHTKRHSENLPVSASQSPMPLICKSLKSMTNVHMKFGCVPPFTPTSLVHNSIVLCRHRLLWPNCYQLQNVAQMADCNKKKVNLSAPMFQFGLKKAVRRSENDGRPFGAQQKAFS